MSVLIATRSLQVPLRVHDACFTSEVLGSLKCDCSGQLQLAMEYIQQHKPGIVIYLQQEGRGIGLANKIAAYALQEKGLDTVDANRALGLPDDCREYSSVSNILRDLGVKSVKLMTNNPRKIRVLERLGVKVLERLPCIVAPGALNVHYLATKRLRMSHLLEGEGSTVDDDQDKEELEGQFCHWNHDGESALSSFVEPDR
ncbi:hypothetical protein WJX73_000386 [Symbiochloris irregularis]|uniref:GTP cyclohydrolase II n=1 Tax=Symbiochloris irregularis TaxID=706552 RepID=A0AAW1NMT3_9CHLO